MMMRSFVLFTIAVSCTCVIAMQSKSSLPWQQDFTPMSTGKIEDIMNVIIIDAGTPDEKETIAANVKVMISDITELAKCAVAVLNRNKLLLSKAANLIETAKDMLGESEDLGAMELMQTILLAKIQDVIFDEAMEDKTTEKVPYTMHSSGDMDPELPEIDDHHVNKNVSPSSDVE